MEYLEGVKVDYNNNYANFTRFIIKTNKQILYINLDFKKIRLYDTTNTVNNKYKLVYKTSLVDVLNSMGINSYNYIYSKV